MSYLVTGIVGIGVLFGAGWAAEPPVDSAVCVEDMPCWDCHTMGNRICGVYREVSE